MGKKLGFYIKGYIQMVYFSFQKPQNSLFGVPHIPLKNPDLWPTLPTLNIIWNIKNSRSHEVVDFFFQKHNQDSPSPITKLSKMRGSREGLEISKGDQSGSYTYTPAQNASFFFLGGEWLMGFWLGAKVT